MSMLAQGTTLEATWESHKSMIHQLYILNDKSLSDVKKTMEDSFGFLASKAQYERYFKKWGFRKNLKSQEWKAVNHQLCKRKREGKESDVYVDELLIPRKKLQKETSRNSVVSIWEQYRQAPSPKMPAGVIICTPSSSDAEMYWMENIPWFRYRSFLESQLKQSWKPTTITVRAQIDEIGSLLRPSDLTLTANGTFQPAIRQHSSETGGELAVKCLDKVNSCMLAAMPENHPGEHEDFLQKLLGPYNQETPMQLVRSIIYFTSNKLLFPIHNIRKKVTQWLCMDNNSNLLQYLLSVEGPTTEALAESLLHTAIEFDNIRAVKTILATGVDPNCCGANSVDSPLQQALSNENIDIARLLIDAGADVNANASTWGWYNDPLQIATMKGNTKLVDMVLAAGARINTVNGHGHCALNLAIQNRNIEVVQILLEKGTDIDFMNEYEKDALHFAAIGGRIDIVKILLAAGADVNVEGSYGSTVLEKGVLSGSHEMALYILDAGAHDMRNAFCIAVAENDTKMVQILLNAGAAIDDPSDEGSTALTVAILNENIEVARMLLKSNANVNGRQSTDCDFYPVTPLQAAALKTMTGLARDLIKAGANVNAPAPSEDASLESFEDDIPGTALQIAVDQGNRELVEILLAAEADVNAPASSGPTAGENSLDGFGGTALQIAVHQGKHGLIEILLAAGADINAAASELFGRTALQAAVENSDNWIVEHLLRAGADIDGYAAEYKGITALSAAIKTRNTKLVFQLLDAGVDINNPSASSSGVTALTAAVKTSDIELVQYLMTIGADANDSIALAMAVSHQDLDLVKILLAGRAKAIISGGKMYGVVALQVATKSAHFELVRVLLAAGIDINMLARIDEHLLDYMVVQDLYMVHDGITALAAAVVNQNLPLVQLLLEAGADPNIMMRYPETYSNPETYCNTDTYSNTDTALLQAIRKADISMIEALLEAGANVNFPEEGEAHRTPLQLAAQEANIDIVNILIKANAKVNAVPHKYEGVTALQGAAIGGYLEIAHRLLNSNADVNAAASNFRGRTALEGAAEHGRMDMMQLLLDAGAAIEGVGRAQYDRALEFAAKNGHCAVRRMLQSYHDSRYGASS